MKATFDVKMSTRVLYNFLMSHAYSKPSGPLSHVLGAVILALYFLTKGETDPTKSMIYIVFGVWFLVYLPVSLYSKAMKQVKLNPVYKTPLTYTVDEEGITTSQGQQRSAVTWDKLVKVKETRLSLLLYTGKSYCFVFPKEAMGEQCAAVKTLIQEKIDPRKVKIHGV